MKVALSPRDASPTKAHIDACWAARPRLNPQAFRETLGFTAGKLWLDLRAALPGGGTLLTAWRHGLNGWLLSPATLTQLTLPAALARETLVLAFESADAAAPAQPVEIFFTAQPRPDFTALEHLARAGLTLYYGLATAAPPPLSLYSEQAEAAAARVWGRRKRPGLRALLAPLNPADTALLHHPTSTHQGEAVSAAEYAARLGWLLLADRTNTLTTPDGLIPLLPQPDPAALPPALRALAQAAAAEQALHHALQGWPAVDGRPLFSLLAPLGRGRPPFASPAAAAAWAGHLLPDLHTRWQTLATPATAPQVQGYLAALAVLAPHASLLGQMGAATTTDRLCAALPPSLQPPAAVLPAPHFSHLAASLPGLAGVMVPPQNLNDYLKLMEMPDHPDPAPAFPA
jgi:hypothetical protein